MKAILIISLVLCLSPVEAQDCSVVSRTRVKNTETETLGESLESRDFYSLMIEKTFYKLDKAKPPIYSIELFAASRVLLNDSMLTTKGTFELHLLDSSVLVVRNVTYRNNPLGYCCMLNFMAELEEETVRILSKNPIVTLKVRETKLTTTFKPKRQQQQQAIFACLLTK